MKKILSPAKIGALVLLSLLACAQLPASASAQLIDPEIGTDETQAFRESAGYGSANEFSVSLIIARIIQIVLGFLGVIFVVLVIYAGFLWLTSAGNEEKIEKSKQIMTAAVIGLVIILSAYAITFFVIDAVLEATTGGVGLDESLFNK